jgi:hypothetical protein
MIELPEEAEPGDRVQSEESTFWWVRADNGWCREPIDSHAVYGSPQLGERDPESVSVPIRNASRDLVTAIRTAKSGDRVRVNDNGWMEVVDREGEGFVAVYENGSVEYLISPRNPSDNPPGTFNNPWMRRYDDYSSVGPVECLEINWQELDGETPGRRHTWVNPNG